jgi:hypothetical protein
MYPAAPAWAKTLAGAISERARRLKFAVADGEAPGSWA